MLYSFSLYFPSSPLLVVGWNIYVNVDVAVLLQSAN